MSGRALGRQRRRHRFVQLYNHLPMSATAERDEPAPLLRRGYRHAQRRIACRGGAESGPASLTARSTTRGSYRVDRSSASASRARSSPTRRCCSATSPTGDLDRKAGDEILDLLQALNREHGKTIIMVTHESACADRATQVLHLEKGTLMEAVA